MRTSGEFLQLQREMGKTTAGMCIEGNGPREHNVRHLAEVLSLLAVLSI
ncbi:hypothetical protein HMPREF1570_2168 [Klebsiella oxytoca KA-2]|nr:hypothetical protein HMPREF1570_2168 [Klebsiella oxytoca KA-2]